MKKFCTVLVGFLFLVLSADPGYCGEFEDILKVAEQGNVDAQYKLGLMYGNGRGIPQDYKQAFFWFKKVAEQGYASAQFNLGIMYSKGQGVSQDYKQAVYWYTKAAEQGDDFAQYHLGLLYAEGKGVEKDLKEAVSWYTKAAEQGNSYAWFQLGLIYKDENFVLQDYGQAIKFFTKAIESGDSSLSSLSIRNLNSMQINNQGKTHDFLIAVELITQIAQQGNPDAQFFLGEVYRDYGVPIGDIFKSFEWIFKAAEQGHELAIFELKSPIPLYGNILKDGDNLAEYYKKTIEGLPQYLYQIGSIVLAAEKTDSAIKYITQAAEQGNVDAQYKLGLIFYQGVGVEQDYKKSFDWTSKAAKQGNSQAESLLGEFYRLGNGVTQDYRRSFEWFLKAAEHGNANAQYCLFLMYYSGNGIPKNFNIGFDWLLKSAAQGFLQAQSLAGKIYSNGADMGIAQNYKESFKWFTKAAEAGHPDSQFQLSSSYILGRGTEVNAVKGYAWLIVAKALGNEQAIELVDGLQKDLSQTQLSEGQTLATKIWGKLREQDNYIKAPW
jgi:uncharacterized protein